MGQILSLYVNLQKHENLYILICLKLISFLVEMLIIHLIKQKTICLEVICFLLPHLKAERFYLYRSL